MTTPRNPRLKAALTLASTFFSLACAGALCFPSRGLPPLVGGSTQQAVPVTTQSSENVQRPERYAGITVDRANTLIIPSGLPDTLDPAKYLYGVDGFIGDLYSGLVRLDSNLQPLPDLAAGWDVSDDGTVYTFFLRDNVTFHDGKPFTANDVKFSLERAASPELESVTAQTYLNDIVGFAEMNSGAATEISGIRVVDDLTVEITLLGPRPYFLQKLAYPVSSIVDSNTVDVIEDSPNGTGPFMLTAFNDEALVLVRNPNYYGAQPQLGHIVYLILAGSPLRLYEGGETDMVGINEDLLDRANDPNDPLYGTVYESPSLCTTYYEFDTTRPPFDELNVRLAFSMAVDKQQFNDVMFEGKGVIAEGLYPPGLPGYDPNFRGLPFDPDAARAKLEASSYGSAEALPEIVFTTGGAGDVPPSVALLLQMWQETLGATVRVELIDYDNYFEEVAAGHHGNIISGGWCADYADPENFADALFHSDAIQNTSGYSNPAVDALLEQARSGDTETRLALYRRVEEMLVADAPAIFTNHSRTYWLVVKPYVRGYVTSPISITQNLNLYLDFEN